MSWLNLVLCKFVPVCICIAVIPHHFYTPKKTTVWEVECDKLNSQYITFSWKTKGDWGNSCKHICRHKESTLTDYNSFQDLSGKFFHSKAIDFLNFLSPYKCRKSLTIKTTLMSLNWIIMDQTMRKIYTATHTSLGFQPMHLNSKFLHRKSTL